MKYALIIPARYGSSRFPGKPLVDLHGVPMIVRTYRQCSQVVDPNNIFIATDDVRIENVCRNFDIQVLKTPPTCLTGTDRVASCLEYLDAEVFLNVQGDEPVFNPSDILKLLQYIKDYPGEVLNGVCELNDEDQFNNKSIPKVVMDRNGYLLYMSRAPIPASKTSEFSLGWRQVCAYAFPRKALNDFASRKQKSLLEGIEDIEIIRFLELGYRVKMVPMSDLSVAVDEPQDVGRVLKAIKHRGL